MQLVVNKRLSRGLTVLGHYTWSKNMDNMDNLQTPSNLGNSKAVSNIDRRHVFVASYLYDLPFFKAAGTNPFLRQALGGWQLAGTNTVQSGAYFSIFSGRDNSLTAVGADRANLVGTPALGGDRSKADQINKWFETTAFAQNATGTLGTAGRNIVRGPGAIYWDMAVQKQFIISERQKLGLRAELFNAANHANLANPNGTLTSVSFGRITGTQGGPRNVQFALRYEF